MKNVEQESQKLKEKLIKQAVGMGFLTKAMEAAQSAGRTLTRKEVDSIVKKCSSSISLWVDWGNIKIAIAAASLGTSEELINRIIRACIKRGWLEEAKMAAEVRGYALTKEELMRIVRYYLHDDGRREALGKAAQVLAMIDSAEK